MRRRLLSRLRFHVFWEAGRDSESWNTLISLGEQIPNDMEIDSDQISDMSDMCYMVQGDDPLAVKFESDLDRDSVSAYFGKRGVTRML